MKALIKVGYGCNEHCTFCHTLDVRHIDGASSEVHAKIDRAADLGHTMVVFSGGEATIRPELFEWAEHVVARGLDVGLVTNGLMLAYPDYLEKLLELRLKYVYMSMHAATEKVHKLMVRAETFGAAKQALAALTGKGLDVCINTVVTRQNLDHLRPVVDLVLPYRDFRLKFSMIQPKGGGDKLFNHLMPRVTDVAAKVVDAIEYGLEKSGGHGPTFHHDGLPLCLLPGHDGRYDDLKTHRYWSMIEIGEPDFFPVDDKAKIQPAPCRTCALRGPCPGLYDGYHAEFGHDELRPVADRERSNSFNYVFEALAPAAPAAAPGAPDSCPVLPLGLTPFDRGRHLFVRNQGRLARYRADTRDFADVEIAEIKHDLGQVYFDASRKTAPDDFARDLVQLRRSKLCEPCPERPTCTGLFEPVLEDVFSRDDARVRELLGALHGDVLDVGCGEGPYEDLFAPLAKSGAIRYAGLDPDPARIAGLRARWPWARLDVATAEALAHGPPARFDHILVLRSWNHLPDPAAAGRAFARALRPGGTLLVVDNTAFGLARSKAQTRRGESGPSRFEHWRNDRAADAIRLLSALDLTVREVREVGPATSNQWLVRLVAAHPA